MFNRKKRSGSNPPLLNATTANPSATTAATQAFLRNRASNSSLASAAAGAALRARPMTPTSVADVETKRTLRRSASQTSIGSATSAASAAVAARPATLQRKGSSGSMSERTFRDPSPARSPAVPSAVDAPPVPNIPAHIKTTKKVRRAASMEAPPMRVASPPPQKATGRGSSLGPGAMPSVAAVKAGSRRSMSDLSGIERPSSRNSVNYSYPTGSRPTSPEVGGRIMSPARNRTPRPQITTSTNEKLVYDPNTRRFLPEAQVRAIQEELEEAESEDRQRYRNVAPNGSTTRSERSVPPASATAPRSVAPKPQQPLMKNGATASAAQKPAAPKKQVVVVSDSESDSGSYMPYSSDNDSDVPSRTQRPTLVKKPSIVREDREREEKEDDTPTRKARMADARSASPTPVQGSQAARAQNASAEQKSARRTPGRANGNGTTGSTPSASPARTPRFSTLQTPDNLVVMHDPPGRSISPRKSALKHSKSSSVATDRSASPSEASVTADEMSTAARKKAHRVSFDEGGTVVGQAAPTLPTESAMFPSPQQSRRSWFKGLGKKKDAVEDDEEVMKPRPVLPSFGSVREKKVAKEATPDRPLVMPKDSSPRSQAVPSPPLFTSATGEVIENPLGISTDHAVGSVLAHDALTKTPANISKVREPLVKPTVVDSKEDAPVVPADLEADPAAATEQQGDAGSVDVPEIAVLQATPNLEQSENRTSFIDMPGKWEGSTPSDISEASNDRSGSATPTAETQDDSSEKATEHESLASSTTVLDNSHHVDAIPEETEDEDASVYSDAAEEVPEPDGDGFMSLDAVVDSPVAEQIPGLAITTPPESPTIHLMDDVAYKHNQLTRQSSEPQLEEGWDKAQQYWSGLTAEKKRQKEIEAQQTKEPESAAQNVKKAAKPSEVRAVNNERTYMIKPGSKVAANGAITYTAPKKAQAKPSGEPQMRKSMRQGSQQPTQSTEPQMKKSMRGEQPAAKPRPVSLPAQAASSTHARNLSASAAAASVAPAKPVQRPPPTRRMSSGESASSFKRAQPSTEGISLRRSMRSNEGPSEPAPTMSSRLSIRSLSPVSMRRPSFSSTTPSAAPVTSMRGTMRNANAGSRTLRNPPHNKSSLRIPIPGFGRATDGGSRPSPKRARPQRSRASRFADSSDEDDEPRFWSSRFGDSSDSDDDFVPMPLPQIVPKASKPVVKPVAKPAIKPAVSTAAKAAPAAGTTALHDGTMRGAASGKAAPKSDKVGAQVPTPAVIDGPESKSSTTAAVLATSSHQPIASSANEKAVTSPTVKSNQGKALSSGSLRRSGSGRETIGANMASTTSTTITAQPAANRKRGVLSSILGRRKPRAGEESAGRVKKIEGESAARRDTPLERSKEEIVALRQGATSPVANGAVAVPAAAGGARLQKRVTGKVEDAKKRPETGTSWPLAEGDDTTLAPPTPIDADGVASQRPFSADGPLTTTTAIDGIDGQAGAQIEKEDGATTARPDLGTRRFTATGLGDVDFKNGVVPDGGKRKKKGWKRLLGMS